MRSSYTLFVRLAITFVVILAAMSVFESTKQSIWPSIGIWQSHLITIFFSSTIAVTCAYFIFRRADWMEQRLTEELRERQHAETELRKSEEDLRITLDSIGDAVIATDAEGKIRRMNPVAERLTGWPLADARSKNLTDVFNIRSEETGEAVESPVIKVLREGVIVGLANHTELISRSGRALPIADSGAPIRDVAGRIVGVVLVFRDQTAERQAEQALRQSAGLMNASIANLPFELWAKGLDGKYTLQNPASKKVWGDQIGKESSEHLGVAAEVKALWKVSNARALAGEVVHSEWERKEGTNGTRIFQEVVGPIYDGDKITGVLGVNIDITDQRRAERTQLRASEALRQSEERFQIVMRAANDGIWDRNLTTDQIFLSDRFLELLGYTRADCPDAFKALTELLHADDRSRMRQAIEAHLKQRVPYDVEYRLRTKSNGYRWFRSRGQAIWSADGTPVRMAGSIHDITDRKLADEKLMTYQQQLQTLSSRLLLIEERERRNFSQLLHDHIGQSLTYAKLRLGVLRSQISDKEVLEPIEDVLNLVEQMSQETRSLTYELSPPLLYEIGLDAALEWLCEHFEDRYELRCKFEGTEQPERLEIDARIVLFQAARELLFNVVKHAKAGEAQVSIARSDGRVRLSVKDNGIGMKAPLPAESGSAGFGLFSVRERLQQIGGIIQVESQETGGTCVSLILPIKLGLSSS
jgi:two-component system sensor histidine kinase UhpB